MATAYYGSKISPHMTKTPEGFLICHDVPINRIGVYKYLGCEIGPFAGPNESDKEFSVLRRPDEVFAADAMASFEMKPVCDGHPPEDVTAENIHVYGRGHVHNVRKGTGKDEGYTLADIMITDPQLIEDVEKGKREVSCGYNYTIFQNPNKTLEQRAIRGNHIAIVKDGRAGSRVAIKDARPNIERRPQPMGKNTIFGRMIKSFAKDATPEELVTAIEGIYAPKEDVEDEAPVAPTVEAPAKAQAPAPTAELTEPAQDEAPSVEELLAQLVTMLKPICAELAQPAAEAPAEVPAEDEDDLSQLIPDDEEAEEKAEGEAPAVPVVAEDNDTGIDGDGKETYDPVENDDDVSVPPEDIKLMGSDAATAARIVRDTLRKAFPDNAEFKARAKDAAADIRKAYGISTDNSTYGKIVGTTRNAAKATAADAAKKHEDASIAAQKAYDARNPHNKKAEVK